MSIARPGNAPCGVSDQILTASILHGLEEQNVQRGEEAMSTTSGSALVFIAKLRRGLNPQPY